MGRRRRRAIHIVKKTLPKVYTCPRCGMISVRVAITNGNASIGCGSCGLSLEYTVGPKKEPIDIYNEFVDKFMAGRIGAAVT